ncbi:MAG: hypothetical protein ABI435_08865 [Pseudolysinimonas sp.]
MSNERERTPLTGVRVRGAFGVLVGLAALALVAGCSSAPSVHPVDGDPAPTQPVDTPTIDPAPAPAPQPLGLRGPSSWGEVCVLSIADVNAVVEPEGITVTSTEDGTMNEDDPPTCLYEGDAGSFDIGFHPYEPSGTFGFLLPSIAAGGEGWAAPDAASGYRNACAAAQADGGAECIDSVGAGYVISDGINEAVLFINGAGFYDLSTLLFRGDTTSPDSYRQLGTLVAAALAT